MLRIRSFCLFLAFIVLPIPSAANAQYVPLSNAKAYENYAKVAKRQAQGSQSSSGTNASSQTDLDSLIKFLIQGGDIGDFLVEEYGEIDINLKTNRHGTWKFRTAINADPQVYTGLAMALDAAQLADLESQLNSNIDALDDFTVEILLAPDDKESVASLYNRLHYSLSLSQQLVQAATRNVSSGGRAIDTIAPQPLDAISARMVAMSVDNRDKVVFSAKHTVRRGVVGPEETAFVFGFERGISSGADAIIRRAGFDDECAGFFSNWTLFSQAPKTCLNNLLAIPTLVSEASKKERISVSIKYSELDSFEFSDADSSFSQSFASTRSFTLAAAYGRNYTPNIPGVEGARLDATLSFEDVKDNAMLNDRGLLQATYTLDFGNIELPISLTWSNKSELVGDADAKIGGHIGIQFRK